MQDQTVLLHLSLIPHVGPLAVKRLREVLDRRCIPLGELYQLSCDDLIKLGMLPHQARSIAEGMRDLTVLAEEQALIERHKIKIITLCDEDYPRLLREIHAPPPVLYVHGFPDALAKHTMVAVVGSRTANTYGKSVVDELLKPVVEHGWTVVSGGARGIDTMAHEVALRGQGITVAVLGSGLLHPYPRENIPLFQMIVAQGGAVVSPFPLRMVAVPGNFPARNRIIAGMSAACIVVQAAEKSGALITAAYALQEGRDVGVVPGSIFDPLSAGCYRLLREGATPLTSHHDVKLFLGLETSDAAKDMPLKDSLDSTDPLLQACKSQARSFDDLLAHTGYSPDELHSRLWELQIEGKITQAITGLWEAI
jgi:DNA processing protein